MIWFGNACQTYLAKDFRTIESSSYSVVNQPSAYGNGNDDADAEDGNGNVWR